MYIISKATSEYQLMNQVNELMADGWLLAGGLVVAYIEGSGSLFFAQALYK